MLELAGSLSKIQNIDTFHMWLILVCFSLLKTSKLENNNLSKYIKAIRSFSIAGKRLSIFFGFRWLFVVRWRFCSNVVRLRKFFHCGLLGISVILGIHWYDDSRLQEKCLQNIFHYWYRVLFTFLIVDFIDTVIVTGILVAGISTNL